MTRYIAAYDTEAYTPSPQRPTCLEACEAIVAKHREHQMPATFFIVGKALESAPDEYRALLDDPLFEVASHTWSHRMLLDHPLCGPGLDLAGVREEVVRGKEAVDRYFPDRCCLGLRPGCSFEHGLRGAKEVLALVAEAGYAYVSSTAWGSDYSLPAPLNQSHSYAEDGFPELWEHPTHGWHENLLKGNNRGGRWDRPARILAFPPQFPEAVPPGYITTPAEEFQYNNQVFIDRAVREELPFVSLIWHPWSLARFDPAMEMLELTFRYVRDQGLATTTYLGLHRELTGG